MTTQVKCQVTGCRRKVVVRSGMKYFYCADHKNYARTQASKLYADKNRARIRRENRVYQAKYKRVPVNDKPPDRGKILMLFGWTISEMTYWSLVGRFGKAWVRAHCAELAQRRK